MRIKIPKNTLAESDVVSICTIRWHFILFAIFWWKGGDKKKLDRYKAIGSSVVAVVDGIVIFYAPRWRKFNYEVAAIDSCLCPR